MKKTSRSEVLHKVADFYRSCTKIPFVPGKTMIPYAGRIYDDQELKNAIDACLDFWLTAGR
ncbi:MAG: hypothetical protein WC347_04195, partial [Smithellaceae bacterium]